MEVHLISLCSVSHKIEVLVSHQHITGVREANNSSFAFVWLIVMREGRINLNHEIKILNLVCGGDGFGYFQFQKFYIKNVYVNLNRRSLCLCS